jgi:hypothetical protein
VIALVLQQKHNNKPHYCFVGPTTIPPTTIHSSSYNAAMDYRKSLERFIFLILLAFFVNSVVISFFKWWDPKIGMMQKMNTSPNIKYPSLTICPVIESNKFLLDYLGRKIRSSADYDAGKVTANYSNVMPSGE